MDIVALKYHLPSTEKIFKDEKIQFCLPSLCVFSWKFCKYWLILEQYPVYVSTQCLFSRESFVALCSILDFLCRLLISLQNHLFRKTPSGKPSVCQTAETVWIQIRPDFLFSLILVNGPNYLPRLSAKDIEDKIVKRCSKVKL